MSNHCIEVICHTCGTTWCVRGCNSHTSPNQELAIAQGKVQGKAKFSGEPCPYCGNDQEVYYYQN